MIDKKEKDIWNENSMRWEKKCIIKIIKSDIDLISVDKICMNE